MSSLTLPVPETIEETALLEKLNEQACVPGTAVGKRTVYRLLVVLADAARKLVAARTTPSPLHPSVPDLARAARPQLADPLPRDAPTSQHGDIACAVTAASGAVTAEVEEAGTDLWDLSADPSIARFLVGCVGHGELFVALITQTTSGRLAEIALGTLANIAANPALGLAISNQAPSLMAEILGVLLETEDVQVLGEALRFFRSLLHAEESYISGLESDTATDTPRDPGWMKRLAAHPAAMARLLFIAQNSLRAALVLAATELLEQLIYEDPDLVLASLGHAAVRFVPALCALLEPPATAVAWGGDGDVSSDCSAGGGGAVSAVVDPFRENSELDRAAVKILGYVSTTQAGVALLVAERGRVAVALARVQGDDALVTQIATAVRDVLGDGKPEVV